MSSQQTPSAIRPKPITALKARHLDFEDRVRISGDTQQRYEEARLKNVQNYDNGVFFDGTKRDTGVRLAEMWDLIRSVQENVQGNSSQDWSFGYNGSHGDMPVLSTFQNVDVIYRLRDIIRAIYRDIDLPIQLTQNSGYGASQVAQRLKARQEYLDKKAEKAKHGIDDDSQPKERSTRFMPDRPFPVTMPKGCSVSIETPFGFYFTLFIPVEVLSLDFKFTKAILFDERVNWVGVRIQAASQVMRMSETLAIVRALVLADGDDIVSENALMNPLMQVKTDNYHPFNDNVASTHPMLMLSRTAFAHTQYGLAVFMLRALSFFIREEVGKSDMLKTFAAYTPGERAFSKSVPFTIPNLPNMQFSYSEYSKTLRVWLDGIARSFDLKLDAPSAYTVSKESYPVLAEIVDRYDPCDPVIQIIEQTLAQLIDAGKTPAFVIYEIRQVDKNGAFGNAPSSLFEDMFEAVDANLPLSELGKSHRHEDGDDPTWG